MLVCIGRVKSDGRFLGMGEEIPDLKDWSNNSIRLETLNRNIAELSAGEIKEMRAVQAALEIKDAGERLERSVVKTKRNATALAAKVARLTAELGATEKEHDAADKAQVIAEEAADAFRTKHGIEEPPTPPPPKPVLVPDPEPEVVPKPSLSERTAKANAVLGAFSKNQLGENVKKWYGVKISLSGNKIAVRARAVGVYLVCQPVVDAFKREGFDEDMPDEMRVRQLSDAAAEAWAAHIEAKDKETSEADEG